LRSVLRHALASFLHNLAARAVAVGLRLLPTRSEEDLHLLSRVHAWRTKGSPSATRLRGLRPLTPPPQPSRSKSHRVRAERRLGELMEERWRAGRQG
jgi:hypothetical protein